MKKLTKKAKQTIQEKELAILTKDINNLAKHLGNNPTDSSSRSGLIKKVVSRKEILREVAAENKTFHNKMLATYELNSAKVTKLTISKVEKKSIKSKTAQTEKTKATTKNTKAKQLKVSPKEKSSKKTTKLTKNK